MTTARPQSLRIAVIGGGLAGLAAAYDLTRSAESPTVTIFEASPTLGGLAAGFKGRPEWEWPLEKFYHHLFTNDQAILELTQELGLDHLVEIHRPTTVIHYQGQNYPLDSPLRVLQFPHIPFVDRMRMGMVLAYLRYHPLRPWRRFDRMLADQWLHRWMGQPGYQAIWQPMLQGKFGPHYKEVNLAWFWARIVKRTPQLGYYRGGFQAFVDGLADQVRRQGVAIHPSTPVRVITAQAGRSFRVALADGSSQTFDQVLSTVSPELMGQMTPSLPPAYLGRLAQLKSMGAVVVTLSLNRQLTPNVYWNNVPKREGLPFLALVEHTNMIDPAHYAGDHLLYLGDYLDTDHPYFEMELDQLLEQFLPALPRFNPDFRPDWVTGAWVHKAHYAQPVPPVGYADLLPAIRTPIAGLYFASMSQVYPWDRGTNYAVEMGRRVARMMRDDQMGSPTS